MSANTVLIPGSIPKELTKALSDDFLQLPDFCFIFSRDEKELVLATLDASFEKSLTSHFPIFELLDSVNRSLDAFLDLDKSVSIGFELKKSQGPMCPNYHVDHVDQRFVSALLGPGTQWLSEESVTYRPGGKFEILYGSTPQRANTGARVLLRGTKNKETGDRPAVHASPEGCGNRYVLRLEGVPQA